MYLSNAEYIARFGDRETVLLTNDTALAQEAPTYDSAKVDAAISDATEVVEGYIGRRYVVPVESPPAIVKGWVAALAREALHVNVGRVNDAVQTAADRARAQLKDVVKGDLTLPIAEGSPALEYTGAGIATSSLDRPCPVVTDSRLADFVAPFTGDNTGANWRGGR